MKENGSIILIDPDDQNREVLAERLRMQGYKVTGVNGPADGALVALSNPPSAVIADLWMPTISGVQLCRLLRAEPATETVPVILRGPEDQRNRFWAERAGAAAYVARGRMGDLVRALARAISAAPEPSGFSIHLSGDTDEIRDRIASYLDAALFESVIAAEVRALSLCGEFSRLFDLLSQLMCQLMTYRWLAVVTDAPSRFALHTHPAMRASAEREARAALKVEPERLASSVEDEDAQAAESGPPPVILPIKFVDLVIGQLAVAGTVKLTAQDTELLSVLARELGGPIRMAMLVEEAQRLATVDPLTSLMNRRAFLSAFETEIERSRRLGYPISVALLDIDHFKQINDRFGHITGDLVLGSVGRLLNSQARKVDLLARWGGEEFVIALSGADEEGAITAAERLRDALAHLEVNTADGRVPVTGSFGVAQLRPEESSEALIDRADRAMYASKIAGRNRVSSSSALEEKSADEGHPRVTPLPVTA